MIHQGRRGLRSVLAALLAMVILLAAGTALADRSPAGIVDDRAHIFQASQLEQLDEALGRHKYLYLVLVMETLPEGEVDPQKRPEDQIAEWAAQQADQMSLPPNGVLITITTADPRLVDFRVHRNGVINQAYKEATGKEFQAYADTEILNAFAAVAGRDLVAGIIAAADTIESIVPPASSPGSSPAPSPASSPRPSTAPTPTEPMSLSWLWWALAILGAGGLGGRALIQMRRYRVAREKVDALRIAVGESDDYTTHIAVAHLYTGAETRELAQAASDHATAAQRALGTGSDLRERAIQAANRMRYGRAGAVMNQAADAYEEASKALGSLQEVLARIDHANESCEQAIREAQDRAQQALALVSAQQEQTGDLTVLVQRLSQAVDQYEEAAAVKETDPVRAARLAASSLQELERITADVGRIDQLVSLLAFQTADLGKARSAAATLQASGITMADLSPAAHDEGAERARQEADACLREGDVPRAEQALSQMQQETDRMNQIVQQHQEARDQFPHRLGRTNQAMPRLRDMEAQAAQVLATLRQTNAPEDWQDVAGVPGEIGHVIADLPSLTARAEALAGVQSRRFVQAVGVLAEADARIAACQEGARTLFSRPDELARAASAVQEQLRTAESTLQSAESLASREALPVSGSLHGRMQRLADRMEAVRRMGQERPLQVRAWERQGADVVSEAEEIRRLVEEQYQAKQEALKYVAEAQHRARTAMQYSSYVRNISVSSMDVHVSTADTLIAQGRYEEAVAAARLASQMADEMEEAYRAEKRREEEERRRREAEERARRQRQSSANRSSFGSSGGGGSWGSKGGNKSSGGGGKW